MLTHTHTLQYEHAHTHLSSCSTEDVFLLRTTDDKNPDVYAIFSTIR